MIYDTVMSIELAQNFLDASEHMHNCEVAVDAMLGIIAVDLPGGVLAPLKTACMDSLRDSVADIVAGLLTADELRILTAQAESAAAVKLRAVQPQIAAQLEAVLVPAIDQALEVVLKRLDV